MAIALAFALMGAAPPPATRVPTHQIDERQAGTTIAAEAGDRIVVRLDQAGKGRWQAVGPLSPLLVPVGGAPGSFSYQLRGAGKAELVFAKPGAPRLRFRILSN